MKKNKQQQQIPRVHFPQYFCYYTIFQKSVWYFFDQVARDVKSRFTFEKWPLAADLKIKMAKIAFVFIFWFSALPLEVIFQI